MDEALALSHEAKWEWFPWAILALASAAPFIYFFRAAAREWFANPMFSYGILMPLISAYLIAGRMNELKAATSGYCRWGLLPLLAGCALAIMGTLSGLLFVSGLALCLCLFGEVWFIWGVRKARIVALPMSLLIFMAPWPTFLMSQLSWRLQQLASLSSAALLRFFGAVVYQDGNLLVLPNYILEVKEACSGTRSFFALLALSFVLAILMRGRWPWRVLLVASAPAIALLTNVLRIVGTGLAVQHFGTVATEDSVHTLWGLVVFVFAFGGLICTQRFLKWASYKFESA